MSTRVERAKQRNRRMLKVTVSILVVLALTVLAGGYIYTSKLLERDTIHEGVKVKGIYVEGLTKEEARKKLEDIQEEKLAKTTLKLKYGEYERDVAYSAIGAEYDYDLSVENAYEIGRGGAIIDRIVEVMLARSRGSEIGLEFVKNPSKIDALVNTVEEEINRKPENADLNHEGGKISIKPGVNGQTVDREQLKARIDESIGKVYEVEVPVELKEPKVVDADLERIEREIGSYSTSFSSSDTNRNYNILLSSNSIDGKIIMPGEVFSFNDATGLRDRANGYKSSIVIVNKKPVQGVGGGVCQTSSTLYNAVARAGVEIVERHNHSLPVGYVPHGQDATVADYSLDFRFKNNLDSPIYIKSDIVGNTVAVKIYGK